MTWAHEQITRILGLIEVQDRRIERLETQVGYYETFIAELMEDPVDVGKTLGLLGNLKNSLDTVDEESG